MTRNNRLSAETSPYLLQHAANPVDWYPWGPEALQRAESEDKPILLSVGYAACHWCHVMAHESFEDEAIAALMNEYFVCIKVDREERPDIDDIYMTATVALTGSGGWPMTVFLTPEQAPFFAGTYFPPQDRNGMLGFQTLLGRIAELWEGDRDQLFRQAGELTDHVRRQSTLDPATNVSARVLQRAVAHLARSFDQRHGGFGPAPKFPPCQALHLLMRHHARTADKHALTMVTTTLDAMKNGGIYDHLGGGFARYSVDERWLVPHFEKMLYDNAQLASLYLEAYQLTSEPEYRRVATETLDYVIRDMQTELGGYASATDADSEGVEGKFFTFTPKQLRQVLEAEEVRAFCAYFDVTDAGNFEGSNILNTPRSAREVAADLGLEVGDLRRLLSRAKDKVFEARKLRVPPLLDDKVLVSWNGLMVSAMARGARILDEAKYFRSAERAVAFIFDRLRKEDGRLLRTARGGTAHLDAYLEDYAYLGRALIDLYEASGQSTYLSEAKSLSDVLLSDFHDPGTGTFFQTSHQHEELLVRTRDGNDGALPNASAIAAEVLYRLGKHLDDSRLSSTASDALRAYGQRIEKLPRAHLTSLNTLDAMLSDPVELVFAGSFEETAPLRREAAKSFLANSVIAHATEAGDAATPLTRNKTTIAGKAALYICRNYQCERPLTSPADARAALKAAQRTQSEEQKPALKQGRLQGRATAEGTRRLLERAGADPTAMSQLGKTTLWVSRVGFGTHRVHREIADHQRALTIALESGCNLIDTAPGYSGGGSEETVGNALGDAARKGSVSRDEVIVCSKLGMLDVAQGGELPQPSTPSDDGQALCLDPEFLEGQLAESLERLNIETLDVCLLHNPETLLRGSQALTREQLIERLAGAFEWLERQVQRGTVAHYGLSTNGLTLDDSAEGSLAWSGVLAATGARTPHFSVVQLPLNPVELSPAQSGLLERLQERGLAVITQRPLNAILDDQLWRLADAPEHAEAPELAPNKAALAALEAEFEKGVGAVLEAVPDAELPVNRLLRWSEQLGPEQLSSRAAWNHFERGVLAPQLSRVLAGLDHAFTDKQLGQHWRSFKKRYVEQLEICVLAARQVASGYSNRHNAGVARALREHLEDAPAQSSLAQNVVFSLSSLPTVNSVLVGMRDPAYVTELVQTLHWDAATEPFQALLSAHEAARDAS